MNFPCTNLHVNVDAFHFLISKLGSFSMSHFLEPHLGYKDIIYEKLKLLNTFLLAWGTNLFKYNNILIFYLVLITWYFLVTYQVFVRVSGSNTEGNTTGLIPGQHIHISDPEIVKVLKYRSGF